MSEHLVMKNNPLRIILDTNLWISFLISKNLQSIDCLIEEEKIKFIFSEELLEEFVDVVSRPKFKKYFSPNDIEKILNLFDEYGELITVKSSVKICRDFKDDFLLNLAIDSKSDFLITGDNDLLVLNKIESTEIISISDFLLKMTE